MILMGVIGAAQGVKGEVRIKSYTGRPTAIGDYGLLATDDGRRLGLLSVRLLKDDMVVARLAGVTDRTGAEALTNTRLYIERARLPPPDEDEFYLADLVGLEAGTPDGAVVGLIRAVGNYGGGDLLAIETPEGGELLVPFTRTFVPVVDLRAGRVVVDEGALDSDEAGASGTASG